MKDSAKSQGEKRHGWRTLFGIFHAYLSIPLVSRARPDGPAKGKPMISGHEQSSEAEEDGKIYMYYFFPSGTLTHSGLMDDFQCQIKMSIKAIHIRIFRDFLGHIEFHLFSSILHKFCFYVRQYDMVGLPDLNFGST